MASTPIRALISLLNLSAIHVDADHNNIPDSVRHSLPVADTIEFREAFSGQVNGSEIGFFQIQTKTKVIERTENGTRERLVVDTFWQIYIKLSRVLKNRIKIIYHRGAARRPTGGSPYQSYQSVPFGYGPFRQSYTVYSADPVLAHHILDPAFIRKFIAVKDILELKALEMKVVGESAMIVIHPAQTRKLVLFRRKHTQYIDNPKALFNDFIEDLLRA